MSRAPISVAMICRGEAPHIEKTYQSIRDHVEELVVVDTGSEDATPEITAKYADKTETWTGCNDEQGRIADFSAARERSFALATQPWVMWLDGDDTVENAHLLGEVVKRYEEHPTAMVILPYDYAHDAKGNVNMTFYRERIVKPKAEFRWLSPVHEVLAPSDPTCPKFIAEDCRITHMRSKVGKVGEPGRNLRILQRHYAKTGESDARTLYYMGLEYGYQGNRENSLMFHRRYCQLSGWDDEKALSHIEIVKHLTADSKWDEAIDWALRIQVVKEDWGEPYYHLCRIHYFKANGPGGTRRDWEKCAHFGRKFLETPPTRTILFINPMERSLDVHRYLNHALNYLGDVRGALESAEMGLAADPGDGNLSYNRSLYVEFLERQAIQAAIRRMREVGKASDEQVQIVDAVVQGKFQVRVPGTGSPTPGMSAPPAPQLRASQGPGLEVSFYVGPGVERWNPDTIEKTGCGGSEAMAWELSKRLAQRGHRVRVYADCAGLEGNFGGVEWLEYQKFAGTSCDVLVASRRPQALDQAANVQARARFLWVHDVHCGQELDYRRTLRADRILCLSQWHKDFFLGTYQHVHPDQVLVTRNGIDLGFYEGQVARDPHRMFYSSSPDRGIQVAVQLMPRIRERVPDASLHVYYGFDVWEKFAPPEQQKTIEFLRQLIKDHEGHGVTYHGRVSAKELAQEQMKCGVWPYPTWFSETSCRTAMEAQLAGCRMVTSPIAALNETVGERGVRIPGDWLSSAYQDQFVEATVKALTDPEDGAREANREFARKAFDIESLADEWHLMFYRVLRELEVRPIPPYRPAYERSAA